MLKCPRLCYTVAEAGEFGFHVDSRSPDDIFAGWPFSTDTDGLLHIPRRVVIRPVAYTDVYSPVT